MKNKPKPTSQPKKQPKPALKKTPAVKATLLGRKKKPAEKTGKNKIGTPDNANLHKMEKELRETKERLRLLSEAAEEGIAIHDKGVIIDANDALARIFGYELSEIIGMKAERFATPESWKVIREHIATGYDKPYEGVGVRKDGSTFICSLIGKPYKYKGRSLRLSAFHDITERKQKEEALRENEQRLASIYNTVGDVIFHLAVEPAGQFHFASVNSTFLKVTGLSPEMVVGRTVNEVIPEPSLTMVLEKYRQAIAGNTIVRWEEISDYPTGRLTGVVSIAPVFNDKGTCTHLVGSVHDITERKKAEEALRESKNRLRAQYNGNPIPTFTWQKQGDEFILTDFNDSAKTFTSGQRKTFLGRQASEMYKSRWEILGNLKRCFDEKRIIRIESRSEHFMPGKFVVITFVFAPPDMVMVYMEDITERKQAEEELHQSEEKYRTILENIQEGYFEVDLAGNLTFFNDSVCRVLGYSRKELMGMNNRQYTDKEESKKVLTAYNKVYKTGKPLKEFGYWISRKDGCKRYIEGSVTLLKNASGKPTGFRGITNDFTERKRVEESLKDTELKFRTIFDSAADGIILLNVGGGKFSAANEKMCNMLGYTNEELLNLSIHDLHPQESIPFIIDQYEKILKKEILIAKNIPVLKKDKTVFFADISGSMITLKEKEYSLGVFRDITERKRSEEEIKSAKVFLDMIIDMSPFAMWISDKEGTITRVNLSLCNVINLKEDEIVGKYNVLHDVNLEIQGVMPMVRAVFEKHEPARFIIPWKTAYAGDVDFKGARDMHIDVSMFPILNAQGELTNVVCQWVDITERKQAEEALRENEIKYRTLFESASDTIFLMDQDIFIDCNQEALKMFGCTREQIIGQSPYRFSPEIQPDGRKSKEKALEKINAALRGQPQHFEWKHLRYDGTLVDAEISLNALNDMGKYHIQAICRDITERKKVEEELKKYHNHLEELVHERTIKLEASNKELEAFSYSASHDLRAPLRTIEGFSQALLEDCEDKLDIQGKDYLIRIRTATRHMAELIEDLLQLSRITRAEMNIENVDLTRIARSVIDELQKSQPQRHVEIRIADGMEETADLKLMRIVLENLLGNAWKFTAKKAQAVIEFGFMKEGDRKAYFIRDNGVGFDMAYADKLFAPFQRLHTDDEFPGTGIGLATVQRIINRHGGTVWTEGQTDKGATFYFCLNQ